MITGFMWGLRTNWNDKPLILIGISAAGILLYILLRNAGNTNKPIVNLKFNAKGASRSRPAIIADISPKEATGKNYVIEVGGTYHFKVSRDFELVVQNNSANKAYKLIVYRSKGTYPLEIKSTYHNTEPLSSDKAINIGMTYHADRAMTHNDADKILKDQVPEDLKSITFIASYQNENGNTYYTKFTPANSHQQHLKVADLENFEKI